MTTDERYSDLVTPPEHRTAGGRDWYIRTLHDSRGAVVAVNLLDSNGAFVREFSSLAECEDWLADYGEKGAVMDNALHTPAASPHAAWPPIFLRAAKKASAGMGGVYGHRVSGSGDHSPIAAGSTAGDHDGAGAIFSDASACRALRQRHGALYGLSRSRRAAAPDRRSRARVYIYCQL